MKVVYKAKTKTGSEGQIPFSIATFTIATKVVSI